MQTAVGGAGPAVGAGGAGPVGGAADVCGAERLAADEPTYEENISGVSLKTSYLSFCCSSLTGSLWASLSNETLDATVEDEEEEEEEEGFCALLGSG
ncbi:hypothetical protein EYF80_048002 [Liparis tanakae]|uniref:Uncharacterized protein n=1 Tax=Liparis tanakae TaxID=230148 RepID=A0A4Z2FM07_9TELE|nr:hypothetical protein EYF80_048002 [Liparis tanakae]